MICSLNNTTFNCSSILIFYYISYNFRLQSKQHKSTQILQWILILKSLVKSQRQKNSNVFQMKQPAVGVDLYSVNKGILAKLELSKFPTTVS